MSIYCPVLLIPLSGKPYILKRKRKKSIDTFEDKAIANLIDRKNSRKVYEMVLRPNSSFMIGQGKRLLLEHFW